MNSFFKKAVTLLLCLSLCVSVLAGCAASSEEHICSTLSPEQLDAVQSASPDDSADATKPNIKTEEEKAKEFNDAFYTSYSNENFDVNNISLTFAVLSDLHIGLHKQSEKLESGMKFLSRRIPNGLDAVLLNGDITNSFDASKNENQIIAARDGLVNNLPENTVFFYSLGPSHDCGGYDERESPDGDSDRKVFIDVLGNRFHSADVESKEELEKGMKHAIIEGYHFFSLDIEKADYSSDALKWLREELEKVTKAEPNKSVFVMTHIPASTTLSEILNDFPQVIYFSGHEHLPFNHPSAIFQGNYTSLSIGGFAYYREAEVDSFSNRDNNNNYEYAQGYLVEVDTNGNTRVLRYDFYNEEVLDESWVIPSPKDDESHLEFYSNKVLNKIDKPEFPENAEVSIKVNEENPFAPVEITFPAAKAADGNPVIYYAVTIDVVEGSGVNESITKNISSMYMKYPNNENMPESYTVYVDGVATPYSYNVSIKAYNSRNRNSAALEGQLKSDGFADVERETKK